MNTPLPCDMDSKHSFFSEGQMKMLIDWLHGFTEANGTVAGRAVTPGLISLLQLSRTNRLVRHNLADDIRSISEADR